MLRKSVMAAYGFMAFPLAALTLPVQIFLPAYYAQHHALGLGTVGLILLLARSFDVISDPVIGHFSDRTNSPLGRRKPWIIAGLPLVMLACWFLLVPQISVTPLYFLCWSILLYIGWSMMILPLNAWGAELSKNYHQRTVISAWREGFTVAGILAALALIAIFGAAQQPGLALFLIAAMVLIIAPLACLWMALAVPDPKFQRAKKIDFRRGLTILRQNKPFRRLMVSYLLNGIANGLPATLFIIFVQHGLGMPEKTGILLSVYFLCGIISVPFWTWLSKNFSKHRTWCAAMIWACLSFALVWLIGPGDFTLFLWVCIATGFALGADLTLPASMQADVVDVDTNQSGEVRTGLYFALWSMATKLALAIAGAAAFLLLDLSGFSLDFGGDMLALYGLYAATPIVFKIAAIALMWSHPLDQHTVTEIQNAKDSSKGVIAT
jgi:Na+/melibiose symporter-like transporter